jgi:hypothetical protein
MRLAENGGNIGPAGEANRHLAQFGLRRSTQDRRFDVCRPLRGTLLQLS